MEKATVISGSHKSQVEVPQHAWTEPLSLSSPSYLFSSYVSLLSKNPKLTIEQHIWQHKVQVIAGQMQEWLAKKASHCRNVELLNEAIESRQVGKVQDLLGILQDKLSNEEAAKLVDSAIASNQDEIVDALVASDQIDVTSGEHGKDTVLHSILYEGDDEANWNIEIEAPKIEKRVQTLLKREINVNIIDRQGNAPIHLAMSYPKVFNALLQHPKTDVNIKDEMGWTPIFHAINDNNIPAFEALLQRSDTNVNIQDKNAHGLLYHVIEKNNMPVLDALLRNSNIDVYLFNLKS